MRLMADDMTAAEPEVAPLDALAANALGTRIVRITEMPGGASTRRYYRVELDSKPHTAVAMYVPEGGKPEEIAKDGARHRWPFLEVRDLLARSGVDVPALYAEDQPHGWLLLEDLGDDTLANYLARNSDQTTRERLYRRAVVDLAKAQQSLTKAQHSIVHTRAFDADLLRWEIDHFREWGIEARGYTLTPAQRQTFDDIAERLAARIASWPRGFVHRDYQSRNLMVRGAAPSESLCWLDFQDALLGPRIYDLVALLNDSYQSFDRPFVEARIADYLEGLGEHVEAPGLAPTSMLTAFDYVTVQRKLKDAGRFVFIDKIKNNPSFLRFVTPTVRKVGESLARLAHDADMRALRELLVMTLPHELESA
jgi:aminoglycoside/choline kinase family phosphotransferase